MVCCGSFWYSVLLMDFNGQQGIADQLGAIQIGAVHIHCGDLRVFIGGIVVNTPVGIPAGGINGDFKVAGGDFTAAPNLIYRSENMEEPADAFFFAIAADGIIAGKCHPHKPCVGGKPAGQPLRPRLYSGRPIAAAKSPCG